jgi:hypothetical protein
LQHVQSNRTRRHISRFIYIDEADEMLTAINPNTLSNPHFCIQTPNKCEYNKFMDRIDGADAEYPYVITIFTSNVYPDE